jgi:DNA end-binding protein Ku
VARSVWTGTITFGLVSIPVRLYSAIREHDVHFHQLAPDGSRIKYKRVSEKTGREVDYDKITRGYEVSKGKYVTFAKDELEALAPRTTKSLDVDQFVELSDIDPIYFERTYHVAPDGEGATKAYALLAAVMQDRERIGIGKIVMREKQYLAAIRPYGKGLALSTMLFDDEVVPQADVDGIPSRRPTVGKRERDMGVQIVDAMTSDWKPSKYHDTYQEQLQKLIRQKAKGKTVEVEEEPEESAKVVDLMEALRASLDSGKGSRRKTRSRTKRSA